MLIRLLNHADGEIVFSHFTEAVNGYDAVCQFKNDLHSGKHIDAVLMDFKCQ